MEENNKRQDGVTGFNIMAGAGITVGTVPFSLQYQYGQEENALKLQWKRTKTDEMGLSDLTTVFRGSPMEMEIPASITEFNLLLTAISLSYFFNRNGFCFTMEADSYGKFTIRTKVQESQRVLDFILELTAEFYFKDLPVLGDGTGVNNRIGLKKFQVRSGPGKKIDLEAIISLNIDGTSMEFPVTAEFLIKGIHNVLQNGTDSVKWLDVGKYAGPLLLSRIGFEMGNNRVTLYVDAGVKFSVLLLEFLGLYLSVPMKSGEKVSYGLSGLSLTLSKPPLYLSGGLYLSDQAGVELYTGQIGVRFKSFGATALCSYGKFSDGEASLFAFLMLEFGFGGTPMFYVTGLCAGFGYNRTIVLPSRPETVGSFPLVAAAMGKGDLKSDMTPAQVLAKMDDAIKPCKNQYFVSAGIRFTSFGILESFILLNIEFGSRFELSVLGISRLSLPEGSENPLAFAELALRAVLAPDDGLLCVEGVLSSKSYLLDRNCKLHGGFAFYIWFGKNKYAGDFVVTLGGYRSGFHVAHYPEVDRLGVEWRMGGGLTLSADFYFALVATGVMMGGNLGIVYESGRLKAWLRAWAEFFMCWKPFLYEMSIGISIGASYRWDFFPFYTTFKVELGADLNLWGPPFGGQAHISWFVISFTIRFGSGKPAEPAIEWDEFADTFLKNSAQTKGQNPAVDNSGGRDIIFITAAEGVVRREMDKPTLLDSDHLRLEITSQMMCTTVAIACQGQTKKIASYNRLGILPMKIKQLDSVLTISLFGADEKEVNAETLFTVEAIYSDVPRAIWEQSRPNADDVEMLKRGVPSGLILTGKKREPEGMLPVSGSFEMHTICRNEHLDPHQISDTTPSAITPVLYPEENRLRQIEESIGKMGGQRNQLFAEMNQLFDTDFETDIDVENWTYALDEQLYAPPVLQTLGLERAQLRKGAE